MINKKCMICNKDIIEKRKNQKYCSNECIKTHLRKNKQTKIFKEYKRRYERSEKYKQYKRGYRKTGKAKRSRLRYQKTEAFKQLQKKYNTSLERKEYRKAWFKTSSGKYRRLMDKLKRIEMQKAHMHSWTKKEWMDKRLATKGVCIGIDGRCLSGNPNVGIDKLTMDHIYSLFRAYKDFLKTGIKRIYTINDIQFLCGRCNSKKNRF